MVTSFPLGTIQFQIEPSVLLNQQTYPSLPSISTHTQKPRLHWNVPARNESEWREKHAELETQSTTEQIEPLHVSGCECELRKCWSPYHARRGAAR